MANARFDDSDVTGATGYLMSNMAHLEAEAFKQEFPEYKYSRFVPLDRSAPQYAEQIGVRVLAYRGGLSRYSSQGTDIPTADVSQNVQFVPVHTFATGYRFTVMELNQAKFYGRPLDQDRADAVVATAEADTNRIMLLGGLEENGSFIATGEGLYTSPSVPTTRATATIESIIAAGGTDMAQKVLNFFVSLRSAVYKDQTNTVHKPNTFLLPTSVMMLLQGTLLSASNGSNWTLLEFLKHNFADCTFDDDINLETAGADGTRRVLCYKRDIRVVKGHVPMPLTFQSMEGPHNMGFFVPAVMRTAGVEWRIPKAAHYIDAV